MDARRRQFIADTARKLSLAGCGGLAWRWLLHTDAAFEWISPIGMAHREIIYGVGIGLLFLVGIFLFDLLVVKHGWCGHLGPLGAFMDCWAKQHCFAYDLMTVPARIVATVPGSAPSHRY